MIESNVRLSPLFAVGFGDGPSSRQVFESGQLFAHVRNHGTQDDPDREAGSSGTCRGLGCGRGWSHSAELYLTRSWP